MNEWAIEESVRCVVCPECAFAFDAGHTDEPDGGYSCPVCAELSLRAALAQARKLLAEVEVAPGRSRDGDIYCTHCFLLFQQPTQKHTDQCLVTRAAAFLALGA